MKRTLLLFALGTFAAASPATAQTVRGIVVEANTGTPISGADIRLLGPDSVAVVMAIADDAGRFVLLAPRPGDYRLELARIGYMTRVSKVIAFVEGQLYELNNIELALAPVAVERVDVKGKPEPARVPALERAGYYARKRTSGGYYIERDKIEARAPQTTSELFEGVPGVRLARREGGVGSNVLLRGGIQTSLTPRGNSPYCPPRVFVDGVAVNMSPNRPNDHFDWESLRAQNIEAIEVYRSPSQVPAQYGGAEAMCGVIVVWLRKGG